MHRRSSTSLLAALLLAAVVSACAAAQDRPNTLTPAERDGGWRLLFDGETTAGWRGYRSDSTPAGWRAVDGALTRVAEAGDLVTDEEYRSFELALDWTVDSSGNSGVLYRVTNEGEHSYHTGIEMQVLDDARHPDGRSRLTSAGALYGLYAAPAGVVKPAGEWNHARLVVDGTRVEHWLNGVKVVEAEIGSPDWETRVRGSKFVEWPGFGRAPAGRIALQDHGDRVAYRNMKIRVLP